MLALLAAFCLLVASALPWLKWGLPPEQLAGPGVLREPPWGQLCEPMCWVGLPFPLASSLPSILPGRCPALAFAGITLPRGPCDSPSSAFPVFWGNCVFYAACPIVAEHLLMQFFQNRQDEPTCAFPIDEHLQLRFPQRTSRRVRPKTGRWAARLERKNSRGQGVAASSTRWGPQETPPSQPGVFWQLRHCPTPLP